MAIYRVSYSSMDAHYGPSFIEADSPEEAKRRFGDFTDGERAVCMKATEVSAQAMVRALLKDGGA